jgi:hypothetical protein
MPDRGQKGTVLHRPKSKPRAPGRFQSKRNAFIALRNALATNDSLDQSLRHDLESRIEKLNIDPVEKSWGQEVRAAWRQYDALIKYAADPNGLAKTIERDRAGEYRSATESPLKRMVTASQGMGALCPWPFIGKKQSVVVPAWALGEGQAFENRLRGH